MTQIRLLAIAALLLGCETTPRRIPSPPPPADEARLVPEINTGFVHPDLDVKRAVGIYETESREITARAADITAALELEPGMAVADVGAGTGLFVRPFAEAVGPEGKVYAVDIAPRLVEHMRQRAKAEDLSQVEVILCTSRSAELPEDSVDVVFICDTYHHFEYPLTTLHSLHRALRSGGQLVLVEFALIPGVTREWLFDHVRGDRNLFRAEIESAGFVFDRELPLAMRENYVLRFVRP